MSDTNDNFIDNNYNDYLKLEFNIILKDLSDFISKVILILQDEHNKSGNKIIKKYIHSFESLGDSICYTPPEVIKNDEEQVYELLISFDNDYTEKDSIKDAMRQLWNKYKSEFKSIDL
jgi:hypothetical protein